MKPAAILFIAVSFLTISAVAYFGWDAAWRKEAENAQLRSDYATLSDRYASVRDSLDRHEAALDTILSREMNKNLRGLFMAVMAANEWERLDSIKQGVK